MDEYCHRSLAWTGQEVVLWGCGQAALDPGTGRWRVLPRPPTGEGIAVWTGRELIGWGGGCCGDAWDGGSAYDPATSSWRTLAHTPLAPAPATGRWSRRAPSPLGLRNATAFQAGGRLVVWGGAETSRALAYDPASDRWTLLPAAPVHGTEQTAAWAGDHLIVWSDAGGAALSPALERSTR